MANHVSAEADIFDKNRKRISINSTTYIVPHLDLSHTTFDFHLLFRDRVLNACMYTAKTMRFETLYNVESAFCSSCYS